MIRSILFINFILLQGICLGQKNIKIKKFSTVQGLSNSVISSIAQDNYGFIWIGTQDGLNRFDGYKFTIMKKRAQFEQCLSDNFISNLYFDKKTYNLWISCNYGINIYNTKNETFSQLFHDNNNPKSLSNNVVTQIIPSRSGKLWIGTYGSGVDYFDQASKTFTHLQQITNCPKLLANAKILSLCEDKLGYLWIGTQGDGLFRYDHNQNKIIHYKQNGEKIPADYINTIYEDREQNIWIGSNKGLGWYNRKNDSFTIFSHNPSNPGSISSDNVKCIIQDHNGILWVGLQSGGVSKIQINKEILLQPDLAKFEHIYESEESGLSYNSVTSIFEDKEKNIWVGTYSGGINMISDASDLFNSIQYKKNDTQSLSYRKVWGFCDDEKGNLWIGTDGGGINVYQSNKKKIKVYQKKENKAGSLSDNAILSALRDHNNNLWFGTYNGGVNLYDKKNDCFIVFKHDPNDNNSLPNNDVRFIYEDRKKNIWFGTNGGGASVFQPSTGKFKNYNNSNSLLLGNSVRCILNDREGNYWFGTYGQGIFKINRDWTKSENYIYNPQDEHSIGSQTVYAIIEDKKGQIWVGTEGGGVSLHNPENKTFENFNENNGLSNHIVHGIIEDSLGFLWITTDNGLFRFDTEQKKFINFNEKDGLTSGEFSDGSLLYSHGALYFGNVNGLSWIDSKTSFESQEQRVYITNLYIFNKRINIRTKDNQNSPLEKSIIESDKIDLLHNQSTLTLEFIAINIQQSEKIQYAYMLEGLEKEWNYSGNTHNVTYHTLPAGHYIFKVKASNLSGVWGDSYTSLNIIIRPPFWKTWWAKLFYSLIIIFIFYIILGYSKKQSELKHNLLVEKMTRKHEYQLSQEKLNFFTNITHEFRSPLTLILGPLEDLLREPDIAYRIKKKLMLIYRNSNNLLNLINKLLDFRKVETGLMDLKVSNENIIQTIKEICFPFKEICLEKKIKFTLETETENIKAWFDADKLRIILNNLLSNAYKYTRESGEIHVRITSDDNNTSVKIMVRDTGIGIPDEHLPYIFDWYYRIGQQNQPAGSGIGLALTKSLVELHKGKISVESNSEIGTLFTVILSTDKNLFTPHQISSEFEQNSKKTEETFHLKPDTENINSVKNENKHQKILLVIEDNADIREYIKDSFSNDFKVLDAPDGEKGLELSFKYIPDIIITDIMMPVIDGLEVCRRIKNSIKTCHIPVILLTARDTLTYKQEGYEIAADSYITKPFSMALLQSRVNNLIQSRKLLTNYISRSILFEPDQSHINLKDEKFISDIITLVENHLSDKNLSVEFISSEFALSHSVLYRKIKALTGLSISEFIRGIRLKKAAQLLLSKQYSISEVAFLVGFNDIKYFRQCFRDQYKVLPSAYQNQEISY